MDTAIVTAIGSFSSDIVIKGLKRIGTRVVGTNIYPMEWIAEAYDVNAFYTVPKATEEKAYIDKLLEISEKEKADHILPLTDVEVDVLNRHREEFEARNIVICISSSDTILLCRDKLRLAEVINQKLSDINTIPTFTVEDGFSPDSFPIVCKPVNGRSSIGLKYIHSEEEWNMCKADVQGNIVQPYIEGDIITVDVVRSPTYGKCVAVARKELLRTLNGAGLSVLVFHDEQLEEKCCELSDMLGITGCVNFEFICDCDGVYHFLECNPRFSGGVEFSCIAGYDCIGNHIRAFEEKPIDDLAQVHSYYIARKYEEYVTKVN